jgi:hypothetical protein
MTAKRQRAVANRLRRKPARDKRKARQEAELARRRWSDRRAGIAGGYDMGVALPLITCLLAAHHRERGNR